MTKNEIIIPEEEEKRVGTLLQDSYDKYLKETRRVGFMQGWDVKEGSTIDEIEITDVCSKRFDVTFKVRLVEFMFGKNNEHSVKGIITDQVSIAEHLPLNGFASYCHIDEGETMEKAVVELAKKHKLIIYNKINSWPMAKAVVGSSEHLYRKPEKERDKKAEMLEKQRDCDNYGRMYNGKRR